MANHTWQVYRVVTSLQRVILPFNKVEAINLCWCYNFKVDFVNVHIQVTFILYTPMALYIKQDSQQEHLYDLALHDKWLHPQK